MANSTPQGGDNTNPWSAWNPFHDNYTTPRQRLDFDVDREFDNFADFRGTTYRVVSDAFGPQSRQRVYNACAPILVSVSKFGGNKDEDPEKFLSDFNAFMELQGIDGTRIQDSKLFIASFSLHLKGPAFVWYQNLPYDPYHLSWTALRTKFHEKFVAMNLHNASLYAETTAFNALTLSKDTLEEFHCKLLQKGKRLHKTELDLLTKFIDGLPTQLQFFVRAGRPQSLDDALQSAKIGEAVGYRTPGSELVSVNAVQSVTNRTIDNSDIQRQIETLSNKVDTLVNLKSPTPKVPPKTKQERTCFLCSGKGHFKSVCNWAGYKDSVPNTQCQICGQDGHGASDCVVVTGSRNTNQPTPGNVKGSGVEGRSRPQVSQ